MAKVRIYRELCKGVEECGICLTVCPKDLFQPAGALNPKGYRPPEMKDEAACTGCENCMIFCPDLAIAVKREKAAKGAKK